MKLAGRTRDELIPQRGTGIAPENSFPSAASGPFNPKAADQPTGESVFPFAGRDVEYRVPASRLPLTVSAAENARHNCEWQSQTPWDVEPGEVGPMLAGTEMRASNTPVDDSAEGVGEAIAEGDLAGMINEAVSTFTEPISAVANMAVGAAGMMDGARRNSVEDAFSRLRRRGGGY